MQPVLALNPYGYSIDFALHRKLNFFNNAGQKDFEVSFSIQLWFSATTISINSSCEILPT